MSKRILGAVVVTAAMLTAQPAMAQEVTGIGRALSEVSGNGQPLSLSLQILLLMSLLTVLPSIILMMTSFTRIIIVLSILRQENHFITRLTVRQLVGFGRYPYTQGRLTLEDERYVSEAIDFVRAVAAASFGVPVEGDSVVLPGVVSRKKQIIPVLQA